MAWTEHHFCIPPEGSGTTYEWHCQELRFTVHKRANTWIVMCGQLNIAQPIPEEVSDPEAAKLVALRLVFRSVSLAHKALTAEGKRMTEADGG